MIHDSCVISGVNYKVTRETVISVGADWREFPGGHKRDVVSVTDIDNGVIIMPGEEVFQIAKSMTADNERQK